MFRNIELLRFIFTMIIVTSHVPILLNMLPRYMPDSYRFDSWVLGVDFFFILSGFFFVYTKDKYQTITDFIIREIKGCVFNGTFKRKKSGGNCFCK